MPADDASPDAPAELLADTILVLGHKSPDTDSTASPLIWAWFLSHHGGSAEARLLGIPACWAGSLHPPGMALTGPAAQGQSAWQSPHLAGAAAV